MPGTPVTVVSLNGWTPHILYACAGALLQDLEFGTFLKKAPQRPNLGLWDLIGTFLGPILYPFGTFSRYFHKNATKFTKSKKVFKNRVVTTFNAKGILNRYLNI